MSTDSTQPQEDNASSTEVPSAFFQDLFVDNQPPAMLKTSPKPISRLQEFLTVDYSTVGFSEGYEHHNSEVHDSKLEIIKSEFHHILEGTIDKHRQDIFELHNQLIETRGLSDRLTEQIELRIAEVKGLISKLKEEKQSLITDDGLISKALQQYREGFLRGCHDWHEAKLLAQSTGLF